MTLRFLLREADHGHLRASADGFSDRPHRDALFSDRVVPAASFALLERKPVETGNIENMRGRPAIEALSDVRRGSLCTCRVDRVGDEALPDRVVDLRKTHDRHVHIARSHGRPGDLRCFPRIRVVEIEMVFGGGLTWKRSSHSGARGDHQRSVRPPERISERFDRASVLVTDLYELREVTSESAVIERAVNDAIGLGCPPAQTFRVVKIASVHLGARGDERLGTGVGPCQSEHLMTRVDEFRHDG